jgi:CRISPR-associated protein Cas1
MVILGSTGYVSLEAIRWCADLGITIVQLDRAGRVLMSSPGQAGDARLRSAQAHAAPGDTLAPAGLEIVRYLTAAKLAGQADVLGQILRDPDREHRIRAQHSEVMQAKSLTGILAREGQSATAYWEAWKDRVFVPFSPGDLSRMPVHWHAFTSRASRVLSGEPNQNASDPVNAMLNYAYRVCEAEARHACHIVGLDPALGVGHGHEKRGDAFAFDLMESARSDTDRVVLSMLDTGHGVPIGDNGRPQYFDRRWFDESSDGTCKLVAPITHILAEQVSLKTAPVIGRHAEKVARMFASASRYDVHPGKVISIDPRFRQNDQAVKLDAALTPADLIPDDIWQAVAALIPSEPSARTYKPVPRADNRSVLAGIICHEIYGAAWSGLPPGLGIDRKTCRRRLEEWERLGVWPQIRETVLRARSAAVS